MANGQIPWPRDLREESRTGGMRWCFLMVGVSDRFREQKAKNGEKTNKSEKKRCDD